MQNWATAWVEPAITSARIIWQSEYSDVQPSISVQALGDISLGLYRPINKLDRLLEEIAVTSLVPDSIDSFNSFIDVQPMSISGSPLA
jgi:hypothetical protein